MKKTFQVMQDLTVSAKSTQIYNFQLKENYANCTGFFLAPSSDGTDFSAIRISLDVAQQEVLPKYVDAALFAINSHVSRPEATYDFREDGLPARSSDVQLTVVNGGSTSEKFNAYFILEN